MFWPVEPDEDEEALLSSPALMSRRASESWIDTPPVEAMPMNFGLQRKKSLPDVAQPIQLAATAPLSREEVSALSSMRREEIRRQYDEHERLRANPLLYLVSPQVKDWFSRQQMVLLIFIVNISLIVMFVRLLT
ncbi:uncharacterized protein LOC111693217 [Trichogramma pretiosum]|uniref:uncharacterized protein LOC111693217 n=1 Tax=Trichogramma pretiosum TaxID=7493 RepID=UPI0006C9DCBE|nr:uncharacterized protein LOC111693217 [Trichogramma pretiosum]